MKIWMAVLALLCVVLPVEAKKLKTPKSANAAGYKSHRAPKVKTHKASKVQKNRFDNRIN